MALGKAEVLSEGSDAALYTYGPSAEGAMKACRLLKEQGISLSVLNFTTVKPLDAEAVLAHAKGKKAVFTLEEHAPVGGIGSAVAEVLAQAGAGVPLHVLGRAGGCQEHRSLPRASGLLRPVRRRSRQAHCRRAARLREITAPAHLIRTYPQN